MNTALWPDIARQRIWKGREGMAYRLEVAKGTRAGTPWASRRVDAGSEQRPAG
jgi:hypothetical protein